MRPRIVLWGWVLFVPIAAASIKVAPGEWRMQARFYGQSLQYSVCNRGHSLGSWITHKTSGGCANRLLHTGSGRRVRFQERCTRPLPNGRRVTARILGTIRIAQNGQSLKGRLVGRSTLPNGARTSFSETLTGRRVGRCLAKH